MAGEYGVPVDGAAGGTEAGVEGGGRGRAVFVAGVVGNDGTHRR